MKLDERKLVEMLAKKVGTDEIRLIQTLANDMKVEEAATELGLNVRTAEGKIARMKAHFGVRTAAGLVAIFFRNNLIQ